MNYSKKDVIVGFIIIVLIIIGAFYYKKIRTPKVITTSTPITIEFQEDIENNFKYNISESTTTIELKGNGRGIATNKEILADVENPQTGYFYQGWVENNGKLTPLGKLVEGKGGWMLEFPMISNIEGQKIIISLEKKFDNEIEKRILEGSFN